MQMSEEQLSSRHVAMQALGSLMHSVVTCRPDLQYTAKVLAGHLQHPSAEHVAVALRAVDYLATTKKYALVYTKATGDAS